MIKCDINFNLYDLMGSEMMLEYDEYKLQLQGMENNINELRDSL